MILLFLICSPLTGLFFRTLTFLEHDIKPVFVFDGKPPGEKRAVVSDTMRLYLLSCDSTCALLVVTIVEQVSLRVLMERRKWARPFWIREIIQTAVTLWYMSHAEQCCCVFSDSWRKELRLLAGPPLTVQAQVHLQRQCKQLPQAHRGLVIFRNYCLLDMYLLKISWMSMLVAESWLFMLLTASPITKDCLQLLKFMGVPTIQVWQNITPVKHILLSTFTNTYSVCPFLFSLFLSPCILYLSLTPCILIFYRSLFSVCLYLQAPGDGEALCAQLVTEGKVDAVASEDMDTLPFGAKILIRQLNAKKDK